MLSLPWTVPIHYVTGFAVYDESAGLQISAVWEYKTSIPSLHPLACIVSSQLVCYYESTEIRMHMTLAFLLNPWNGFFGKQTSPALFRAINV